MSASEPSSLDPRAAERRNIVARSWSGPLWLPRHGAAVAKFVAGYAATRARRLVAIEPHAVGKQRPPWLPAMPRTHRSVADPFFPKYEPLVPAATPVVASAAQDDDRDPESLFAQHRWLECVTALFGTDAEAVRAVERCTAWMAAPPDRSAAAWEPYSTAERVANLGVLLSARPAARAAIDATRLTEFLRTSVAWIAGHLEYYGTGHTNNHILNDARALVIGGAILRDPHVMEWGIAVFARLGPELVQANGFLRERSSHYQAVVTNWILDASHFANGSDLPSSASQKSVLTDLRRRVSAATAALWPFVEATGSYIGDVSPDSPPAVTRARLDALYPGWADAAAPASGRLDDWILLSCAEHRLLACVVDGSFPLTYPTHGHSDVTHFTCAWRGAGVLADAGRWRYTKDAESLAQSDARGHNVMLVNGCAPVSESLARGGLWHLRPYSDATVSSRMLDDGLTVEHDGFTRLQGVGRHHRTTRMDPGGITVLDALDGRGTVTVDWLWHFHPRFAPVAAGAAAVSDGAVSVECHCETPSGSQQTRRWESYMHSSAYNQHVAAWVFRVTAALSLPCSIETRFVVSACAA